MRLHSRFTRTVALASALSVALTALGSGTIFVPSAQAQYPGYPGRAYYNQQQIDQMTAQIALYPDPLLAQILTASAYPYEISQANNFINRYHDPYAIDRQPWDDSVKALARYPDVLRMLANDMSWTTALGIAYVNQTDAVVNSIQRWRAQAYGLGNLQNNQWQTVYTDGEYVRIVPAQQQYMYVPQYQPQVIYVERYRPDYVTPFLTFGAGLLIGLWLNKDWDWHHHRVYYSDRTRWERNRPVFYPEFNRVYVSQPWQPAPNRYRQPPQPTYPTRFNTAPVPVPPPTVKPVRRDDNIDRDRNDRDRQNQPGQPGTRSGPATGPVPGPVPGPGVNPPGNPPGQPGGRSGPGVGPQVAPTGVPPAPGTGNPPPPPRVVAPTPPPADGDKDKDKDKNRDERRNNFSPSPPPGPPANLPPQAKPPANVQAPPATPPGKPATPPGKPATIERGQDSTGKPIPDPVKKKLPGETD